MNTLFAAALFATLAVINCYPSEVGQNVIITGPSGIVTSAGPIGPHGLNNHNLGYAGYGGHGSVSSPVVAYGHGLDAGHGLGNGYVALSPHGVTVKGPETVPAVISGPSGKIFAEGLYGVPSYGY